MGNRDTEEMLEAARAECVRLERVIAEQIEWWEAFKPHHGESIMVLRTAQLERLREGNQ